MEGRRGRGAFWSVFPHTQFCRLPIAARAWHRSANARAASTQSTAAAAAEAPSFGPRLSASGRFHPVETGDYDEHVPQRPAGRVPIRRLFLTSTLSKRRPSSSMGLCEAEAPSPIAITASRSPTRSSSRHRTVFLYISRVFTAGWRETSKGLRATLGLGESASGYKKLPLSPRVYFFSGAPHALLFATRTSVGVASCCARCKPVDVVERNNKGAEAGWGLDEEERFATQRLGRARAIATQSPPPKSGVSHDAR